MSPKLPRITCGQLIRALKRAGFVEQRQRGRRLHRRRESDNRRVTVPVRKGRTVPPGTLRAILRDADITVAEFRELLSDAAALLYVNGRGLPTEATVALVQARIEKARSLRRG